VLAELLVERMAGHSMTKYQPSAAVAALSAYDWPGNLRELRNAMVSAAMVCHDSKIQVSDLPVELRAPGLATLAAAGAHDEEPITNPMPAGRSLAAEIEEIERQRIRQALAQAGGNQSHAAELLGMSRRTLLRRLDKLGLDDTRLRGPRDRRRR
jgi:DNA-binding NtrC family response regulator